MKMKPDLLLLLSFALCSVASCRKGHPIKQYEITSRLDSLVRTYNSGDSVINDPHICELFPQEWDSIAILKPYQTFEQLQKFNLTNVEVLDDSLSTRYSEDFCVLLFIKEREITYYSQVRRMPLDFSTMTEGGPTSKHLIAKGACDKIYLLKTSENRPAYQVKMHR